MLRPPHALTVLAEVYRQPCFLKNDAKQAERQTAMKELAACLSATRNRIAHAKANYEVTGKEWPDDQLPDFVDCARLAAEQCIHWFADLAPKFRRL